VIGPPLGIGAGDFVLPDAVPLIGPILAGQAQGPLPANLILDASEVALIQDAVAGVNRVHGKDAKDHGARGGGGAHAPEKSQQGGLVVGHYRLTTEFLGGLFSLDGIHPTNTGYAILANEFIETLNIRFNTRIAKVDEGEVLRTDPLVFQDDADQAHAASRGHV